MIVAFVTRRETTDEGLCTFSDGFGRRARGREERGVKGGGNSPCDDYVDANRKRTV